MAPGGPGLQARTEADDKHCNRVLRPCLDGKMGLSKWTPPSFPDKLDQGAFVFYFLGSVVPLAVLGIVVERYALSPVALPADGLSSAGLLGLVAAICLLS